MNLTRNILTNHNNPVLHRNSNYTLNPLLINHISIHYTGVFKNKKPAFHKIETVRNNWNKTNARYASAHFIVREENILQCLELNQLAYAVGSRSYTDIGKLLKGNSKSLNYRGIAIEMALFDEKDFITINTTAKLCANLMIMFNSIGNMLWIDDIHSHYNLTGKSCPKIRNEDGEYHLMNYEKLKEFRNNVELEYWNLQQVLFI